MSGDREITSTDCGELENCVCVSVDLLDGNFGGIFVEERV